MPWYTPLSDDMQQIIIKKHEKGQSSDQIANDLELNKLRVTDVIKKAAEIKELDETIAQLSRRVGPECMNITANQDSEKTGCKKVTKPRKPANTFMARYRYLRGEWY